MKKLLLVIPIIFSGFSLTAQDTTATNTTKPFVHRRIMEITSSVLLEKKY